MMTFTCSLPDDLLNDLSEKANDLKMPKKRLLKMH